MQKLCRNVLSLRMQLSKWTSSGMSHSQYFDGTYLRFLHQYLIN